MSRLNLHKMLQPGKRVLVVGLGVSGVAAINFLKKFGVEILVSEATPVSEMDSNILDWLKQENLEYEAGGHSLEFFTGVDLIVASPGVPLQLPVVKAAMKKEIPVIGEMEFAAEFLKTPVIAVTGTNGKSTVTELLGGMFRKAGKKVFVGGNIGTPLMEYLSSDQDAEIIILEVSSFQLDIAPSFGPDVAVLLNITADHLERYADFEAYASSKFNIFANQEDKDAAVLNIDDPEIMARVSKEFQNSCYFFGEDLQGMRGASFSGENIVVSGLPQKGAKEEIYDLHATALNRMPNIQNAMAAIVAARIMECPEEAVQQGLRDFVPLAHRLQLIAEMNGISFYDDSKATNVGSVVSALKSMKQPVVLIAGGRDKGGGYLELRDLVKKMVKALVLIGEAGPIIAKDLEGTTRMIFAPSMVEAVRQSFNLAESGDAVLLSPGCASFDMFSSYKERGNVFQKAVFGLGDFKKETVKVETLE